MQSQEQIEATISEHKKVRQQIQTQHEQLMAQLNQNQQNFHRIEGAILALEAALTPPTE